MSYHQGSTQRRAQHSNSSSVCGPKKRNLRNVSYCKQVTSSFISKYQFHFVATVDLRYGKIITLPFLCTFVCSTVNAIQFEGVLERLAVEKISTYEGGRDMRLKDLHRGRILIF